MDSVQFISAGKWPQSCFTMQIYSGFESVGVSINENCCIVDMQGRRQCTCWSAFANTWVTDRLAVALTDRLDWVTSLCSSYLPFLRARSYRGATPVSAISSTFGSVFFLSFFLSCVFLFDKTVDTAFKYLEHMSYVFKAVLLNIYFKCPLVQGYFYFLKKYLEHTSGLFNVTLLKGRLYYK